MTASQDASSNIVTIHYDISDANTSSVAIDISNDGGLTWTVPTTTLSGNVGTGQTAGTGKTVTWNAGTDFPNQFQSDMRVRVRPTDNFANEGTQVQSSNFTVDTTIPTVSNVTASQVTGSNNVTIVYDLSDNTGTNLTTTLDVSQDGGTTWTVAHSSTTGDIGTNQTTGTGKTITWNAETDFNNQFQTDMRVRLRAADNFANQGAYAQSSNFTLDTANPVVSNVTVSQTTGSTDVTIHYDLSDNTGTNLNVTMDISQDGGITWTVAHPSTTGDLGSNQTTGTGKTITWSADTDFDGQYQTDMRVRLRATDNFANQSVYTQSSNFTLDTTNPIVANVTASQNTGSAIVTIHYDLADDTSTGLTTNIDISDDGGLTWTVPTTTLSGNVGTGQTTGTGKTVTWNTGTDFSNQFQSDMRVRVRPTDNFANQGTETQSSNFTVDTTVPTISNVIATQSNGSNNVTISYDLADNTGTNLNVTLDISDDGGTTWTVAHTSTTGNIGTNQTTGTGKTITWNAGTDFDNQFQSDMRVRLRATDNFANQSAYAQSANFTLDTANPVVSNVTASQTPDSTDLTINYDLSDNTGTNLNVTLDISDDGGATWTVAHPSTSGDLGSNQTSGTGKTITWSADTDFDNQFQTDMRVRLRATDNFANQSAYTQSSNFTLDTANPIVSNVTASQNTGSNIVTITYDLVDDTTTGLTTNIDISDDGGLTWTVPTTTLSGNVGTGQTTGTGKTVTWNVGTDFSGHEQDNLRVRVRGVDTLANIGAFTSSSDFSVDTKAPVIATQSNLVAQPNAGDTAVLIGGSFTDAHPGSNNFFVALNGGAYGSATAGDADTVTPSSQSTAVGTTLKGNNYIPKVKLVHTDQYGHSTTNENTNPTLGNIYVKPYTPSPATVNTPTVNSVHVIVNKNASEVTGLDYAIFETTTGKYVQANGTLGTSAVWQSIATWGTVTVTGLSSPVAQYVFKTKSRNSSDAAHAVTSESALSAGATTGNDAPVVTLGVISQVVGQSYVVIHYTGADAQNDTNILVTTEYSLNNTTWVPMTEKSGVGSDGTTGLAFTSAGVAFTFAWNIGADIANTENDTVYIRLKANDGILDGNLATSSAFSADTKAPTISNVTASQTPGSTDITITYDLADNTGTNLNVTMDISQDGGTTWTVAHPSTTGDLGSNQTTGTGKTITWSADTDFDGQHQSDMRVRLRATDDFANQGSYVQSSNFTLDTANPIVSNVTASQNTGSNIVTINYDLADDSTTGLTTNIDISNDGGLTWTVPTTTLSGDVGTGQSAGTGKTVTWNAGTDFSGHEQDNLRVRVRGVDTFTNIGTFTSSSDITVDTKAPGVSGITASQTAGTTDVVIHYTLTDATSAGHTVDMHISSDGGTTWTVLTTSATGDVGAGVTTGSKTITWNAGADFGGHTLDNLRFRIRSRDLYGNQGAYTQSGTLSLDTLAPVLSSLTASQELGTKIVQIQYGISDSAEPLSVSLEISSDGGVSWNVLAPTATRDIGSAVTSGTEKAITWNAGVDFNNQEKSNMRVRLTGIDSFGNTSPPFVSSDFVLDTAPPAGLSGFSQFLATTASISFVWASGVTDTHFNRYELWYGTNQSDVESRIGSARKWSIENDQALGQSATNSTVITSGFVQNTNYFVELFAFDTNGNGSTTAGVNAQLAAPAPIVGTPLSIQTVLPPATQQPVVVPTPQTSTSQAPSQAPSIQIPSVLSISRPILTALATPTNKVETVISGLAVPGSSIELYDGGVFVRRLSVLTSIQGEFRQIVTLAEGSHTLTVKAIDSNGALSDASPTVILIIDTTAPLAPVIVTPVDGQIVSEATPTLTGTGEPFSLLEITLDARALFLTPINSLGRWSFILPNASALTAGSHTFSVRARDEAGNASVSSIIKITRVIISAPVGIIPGTSRLAPTIVVSPLVTSIPPPRPAAEIIREVTKAVEVQNIPPPQVVTAATTSTPGTFTNDIINFSGTALPNEDILIYIHSEQALIYRTKADSTGKWSFNHSQTALELTPGTHTIYAVGLDPVANVKTRPSLVKTFTVEKNIFAVLYGYLNFTSTVFSLIVISMILLWLYRREHLARRS